MSELPAIITNIKHGFTVDFVDLKTNIRGSSVITSDKIQLNSSKLYYVPITNSDISLDTSNIIKPKGDMAEKINIRNVSNGFVSIITLRSNLILYDGELLGWLL